MAPHSDDKIITNCINLNRPRTGRASPAGWACTGRVGDDGGQGGQGHEEPVGPHGRAGRHVRRHAGQLKVESCACMQIS
jgi:hypothetical protein